MKPAPRTLRLVSDNTSPETWDDHPQNALVTFTLRKATVDGCMDGIRNLLDANRNMMLALDAARAGNAEDAEKRIRFAFMDLASANAFAAKVYEDVQRTARRTNRRGGRA
ncbi:hypothetical protein GGQ91_002540 [Methylobacterium fujisawaense]|uniref:Uncharacterized protein n=1 Tax=Methylobacterium fujisawaense TaxID=107400 RepID=A0ABR6DAN3_9HYPH|nr:hypothetical protein [Methylobacterium fujisawaense]MBA9063152.1 hypothetical protein [Methylobacterium fujisawaense]